MVKKLVQPYEKSQKSWFNHLEPDLFGLGFFSEFTMNLL